MTSRFDYTTFSVSAKEVDGHITRAAVELEARIETQLPHSREKALALTKLEEVVMWSRKAMRAIKDEQPIQEMSAGQGQ